MKRTEVVFACLDGERHAFDLRMGQIRELQEKCGAGIFVIGRRLLDRQCYAEDIRETIRLGLIGGGMSPSSAHLLVARYVDGDVRPDLRLPLAEALPVAMAIVGGLFYGAPDDAKGEDDAANPPTATKSTESSTSSPSTEAAPRSASRRKRSTGSSSGNGKPLSTAGTEFTAPRLSRKRQRRPNIST